MILFISFIIRKLSPKSEDQLFLCLAPLSHLTRILCSSWLSQLEPSSFYLCLIFYQANV